MSIFFSLIYLCNPEYHSHPDWQSDCEPWILPPLFEKAPDCHDRPILSLVEMRGTIDLQFYRLADIPHYWSTGATAVHYWASATESPLASAKFEQVSKANPDAFLVTDFFGNYPLHYAAACSNQLAVGTIVSLFREVRFQNSEGISPAHIAAQLGDTTRLAFDHPFDFLKQTTKRDLTLCHA
jgi:ankyrin repeat protein